MVFEGLVVDLINRSIGDYFENLDSSQLKLGIWGGDVVLKDLLLRNSVIDDLQLPFKIIVGKLGSLTMKIPWKSLYTSPVELSLQNLFLLVTPSYSVVYNEDAEEKSAEANKQKEIERIEDARKRELQKLRGEIAAEQTDSFTEKLVTQIIKNVQIRIEGIHIRYEDDVTKPLSPFGFGVTLKKLSVQTTDQDWIPTVISETVDINTFHKMADLEGLSLYWNSDTQLIQRDKTPLEMANAMGDMVLCDQKKLTYVLGPITSVAKMKLTPSPERGSDPFSLPKVVVDLVMKELMLGLTNRQFQDIMELLEAIDFMRRAQEFRKYRPDVVTHKGNYKAWWRFAYRCIVEEEVRRRRMNWDWEHMKRHRTLCRMYGEAYFLKMTQKKIKPEIEARIHTCEKELDVFNIIVVRKQVDMKVERQGIVEKKEEKPKGWFSGWFGGSPESSKTDLTMDNIVTKFGEALTPEEKSKLYHAIDYTENSLPLDYPKTYEEFCLQFHLHELKLVIRDDIETGVLKKGEEILDLIISDVETSVSTRPVGNGLKVNLSMGAITADGLKSHGAQYPPRMISSKIATQDNKLCIVGFESKPMDSTVDKRIIFKSMPLEVVYHAATITHLVKCFTLPPEIKLSELQAAAVSTLNEWREQSAAGLQYMIETRGELEVDIDMLAPYFLVPQGGKLDGKGSVLVLDLGQLKFNSQPRHNSEYVERLGSSARSSFANQEDYLKALMTMSYDTFVIQLRDFHVFLALPGEGYAPAVAKERSSIQLQDTSEYLLRSSKLNVTLNHCLVQDDPRLPRLKLDGSLPLLNLDITEHRLMELIKLLVTLPFPHSGEEQPMVIDTISENPAVAESLAISQLTYDNPKEMQKSVSKAIAEFTEMSLCFNIDAIKVRLTRVGHKGNVPICAFELSHLEAKLTNKTFSNGIDVGIGGLTLCALQHKASGSAGPLYILKTPLSEGLETQLLKVHMFSIVPECPIQFASNKVKQLIKVEISQLDVILHQEALKMFIKFAEDLDRSIEKVLKENEGDQGDTSKPRQRIRRQSSKTYQAQVSKIEATRRAVVKKHTNPKDILLQIDAHMELLTVQLSSEEHDLMKIVLSKLELSMKQKVHKTFMSMELTEFTLLNLDPKTAYKKIVTVEADKVINIQVLLFEGATKGMNFFDMEKHDMRVRLETGSPKIFYLGPFLDDVLNFINSFQAAKDAVKEKAAAAADAARENVEQAYTAATRIVLDIDLKAPIIFIPRNEHSSHGLLADFGNLNIQNSFRKDAIGTGANFIILDDMKLVNLKNQSVISECLILEPVTFQLTVIRNLSSEWYHHTPEMFIEGTLLATSVQCSNEDYATVMACLTENVAAPGHRTTKPTATSSTSIIQPQPRMITPGRRKRSSSSQTSIQVTASDQLRTILPIREEQDEIFTKMLLKFNIANMSFVMHQGTSKLESSKGLVKRNQNNAFASFSINNIKVEVDMLSNGNMSCPISVESISLKDIRPGSRAIKNLIQKRSDIDSTYADGGDIVKFSYKTDKAAKKGAVVYLDTSSLTIVLCLDYLLQIASFFTSTAPPEQTAIQAKKQQQLDFHSSGDSSTSPQAVSAAASTKSVATEDEEKEEEEPLHIYFNMGETEIVLVESLGTIHTNALLMNCEVSVKMIIAGSRSNLMGTVGNMTLSSCSFSPETRSTTLAEIISPMSITFVMNTSPTVGTLVDVNISDIFIRLTAGTLELLLKITSTIGSATDEEEASKKSIPDYSTIWNVRSNAECNFWFLKPDAAVEVAQDALVVGDKARLYDVADDLVANERLVLESGCIVLTFEAGVGSNTMPMLLIETDVDLQAFDWSKKLQVAGRMKLEAAYYNPTYGMWEFLIEPVETRHHGKISHQPWEMLFELTMGESFEPEGQLTSPDEAPQQQQASSSMSIVLQSNDILEMTVTKTALNVVNILTEDFQAAAKSLVSQREVSTSAYTIVNDTGCDVKILVKNSAFILVRKGVQYDEVILKHGTSINLGLLESKDMTKHHTSVLREQEGRDERLLKIEIEDYEFRNEIPVNRAEKRCYSIDKRTDWGKNQSLLIDTGVKDCSKIVTLRSVVQIVNELQISVDVYYMDESGNSVNIAGTVSPGAIFNVPLKYVYTKSCELFFAPVGFSISSAPYIWATLLKDLHGINLITCQPRDGGEENFSIKIVGEVKQVLHESTNRKNLASQTCYIYLKPPLVINNLLPCPIGYFIEEPRFMKIAEIGTSVQVSNLTMGDGEEYQLILKIPGYDTESWISEIHIRKTTPELSQWPFRSEQIPGREIFLGIHKEISDDVVTFHVYSPFWMVNRTGLKLVYKGEDKDSHKTEHPADLHTPVLFSFPGRAFFSKKKAVVKVEQSDWSDKFSLDVAGSAGSVICKSPLQQYAVGVEIQLTSWSLTKTIIFSPRFYLINSCPYIVNLMECQQTDSAYKLEPGTCVPFWPKTKTPQLSVGIQGTSQMSKAFHYDAPHHTVLNLHNKYGGIHVDVHLAEAKTLITFSQFIPGQAPVQVINATPDAPIEITEKGANSFDKVIKPGNCQLLTWSDPMGERTMLWAPGSTSGKRSFIADKLHGDGFGSFIYTDKEDKTYYWISFLDGLQRILLFTADMELVQYLQAAKENEKASMEFTLMFHGLGLSLVDNEKLKESLYMRIASSGIVWEVCKPGKKKRFKPLPEAESNNIEMAYQNYLNEKAISSNPKSHIALDTGIELDFVEMQVFKPQPRVLRRVFQTGVWVFYKVLPHSLHLHAKLNRLQIDNQLSDCIFRVVLAPVAPPRSVSEKGSVKKPFAEVSIVRRVTAHSSVEQFKYFKVLIQEFHVRVDIGFINAVVDLFSASSETKSQQMLEYFMKDYKEVCTKTEDVFARQIVSQGQKHFYDFLHFSPLKIHVSFSMGGQGVSNNVLGLILASLGVTLTEVQDVVFKLSCLELQHMFLSGEQLYDEAYSHYSSQAIKQLYVLVLGLDVIGNPYGLAVGVAEGVEAFFYEPFQGAIQGPGEFAEGLALGVKSLLGHTVGGAAGAFSRITGTLGKGIAALTFDEDYQKKRRENINRNPNDIAEGLARSGKGLVMGFYDGVTGVALQPAKGFKEGGIGGLFKGLGKGLIGVVARPAAGVVDFASGSFDAVKKATSAIDDTRRMRPPRHIAPDTILQPYVHHEAEGVQLLNDLEKGKFAKTDTYIAHALINPHGIFVILLTTKRVFYLKRDELFGAWGVQWSHIWEEFVSLPLIVEKGLSFKLKTPHRRSKLLPRHLGLKEIIVPLYNADVCTWLLSKIEMAMKTETGVVFTEEALESV